MATNTFNNAVKIAKQAMDCLENNLALAKYVKRSYEPMFRDSGAKGGAVVNARVPALGYSVRTGAVSSPQGYTDTYVPITVQQYGTDMQFTSAELELNVEDGEAFTQNVLNPLIAPVANKIDSLLWALTPGLSSAVGVPGTLPTNIDLLLDGAATLDEAGVPRDGSWGAVLHPRHQAAMLKGTTQYFNPQADIAKQYQEGRLGRLIGGFKCDYDQNAYVHTVGTIGTSTPLVKTTSTTGATTIAVKGWASSAATLNAGDTISIAGVYSVNPLTKTSTGTLQKFVVTTATTSVGVDMDTLPISPAIHLTGANQNVSALPTAEAAVYVWDKNDNTYSAKVSRESLLLHPDCIQLCCVDLPLPEGAVFAKRIRTPRLNIPMRLVQFFNGMTDQTLFRIDILVGAAICRNKFGVRVVG